MEPDVRYYSIDFSGDYKEFDSKESAELNKGLLVVIESWEKWENTAYGVTYRNRSYKYKFCQNGRIDSQAQIGPSKIISTNSYRGNQYNSSYNKDNIETTFSDSRGILVENQGRGIRIEGIANVVKKIIAVNSCGDYEKYVLTQENKELKARIKELEDQLEDKS